MEQAQYDNSVGFSKSSHKYVMNFLLNSINMILAPYASMICLHIMLIIMLAYLMKTHMHLVCKLVSCLVLPTKDDIQFFKVLWISHTYIHYWCVLCTSTTDVMCLVYMEIIYRERTAHTYKCKNQSVWSSWLLFIRTFEQCYEMQGLTCMYKL